MRYLIKFSYDGTKFHGFQRQNNVKNVQGLLETVLSNYLKETIVIKGAGRTDAGVHAVCQCAHFYTNKILTKKDIKLINDKLNGDIIINNLKEVPDTFHARYSVLEKTYLYKINVGKYDKEKDGYYYQIKYDLDIKLMQEACKVFIGTHDFHNFVSGKRDDYTSTIFNIKLKKKKDIILIEFIGIGFYRYMVRHLVGAILDVGKKRVSIDTLRDMLDNPSVDKQLSVAPSEGLYLIKIKY